MSERIKDGRSESLFLRYSKASSPLHVTSIKKSSSLRSSLIVDESRELSYTSKIFECVIMIYLTE
jgi:hypothetical protein